MRLSEDLYNLVADATSVTGLRASLLRTFGRAAARWIRVDGIGCGDVTLHGAFHHSLYRCGIGGDPGRGHPQVVAFDWASAADCTADGLALFSVLIRHLEARGIRVICCGPECPRLDEVSSAVYLDVEPGVRGLWLRPVHAASRVSNHLELLLPITPFGPAINGGSRASLGSALDQLDTAVARFGVSDMRLDSLIHELLQNVISHSSSRHAAIGARAVAPRGKTIEIGLADDGVGIAAHVVAQSSHSWLSWLSDASVTETTLANQLSGRDPHSGGGCLGEVMRAFLRQADADVTIRSGTAHVKFANARDFSVTKHNLTFGMGTQILIRIRP